jgi:hypothetical protein
MMKTIRIPATETRRGDDRAAGVKAWAKVLKRVAKDAKNGYGFEGNFVTRGELVNDDEVDDGAVILESAGNDGSGKYPEPVYVLWRRVGDQFVELARAAGREWAFRLRDVARDALSQPAVRVAVVEDNVDLSRVSTDALRAELARRGVAM